MSSISDTRARTRVADPAQRAYRWWVLGVTSLGALLASLTSIALAIGLVTSSMDPQIMLAVFSGTQVGSQGIDLAPFLNALHLAFFAGVIASLAGAVVSWLRGPHETHPLAGAPA